MQISTIKNQNLEKPVRNPFNRTIVKILKKKIFWISLKKNLVPRMLSHCANVVTSKISHACVPLRYTSMKFFFDFFAETESF
jgi:hypothetical protein